MKLAFKGACTVILGNLGFENSYEWIVKVGVDAADS